MTESKSNTVVEGRIGNRSFAELLSEVIRDRHGDRLSQDEVDEATQVAKGISKMEGRDDTLSAGRDAQADVLREKFGIDYDEVERWAKSLRITGETPNSAGPIKSTTDDLAHGFESVEGLLREIDRHNADPSELLLVHDPDGDISELLNEIADADDTAPGDAAVGRKDDLRDARDEKDTLRKSIADDKGIARDSLSGLSLPDLRRLTDDTNGDGDGRPDPRSGDVKTDNDVPRSKRSEYEQLKETQEFLERKTGRLAEKRLETVNERIREIEGRQ